MKDIEKSLNVCDQATVAGCEFMGKSCKACSKTRDLDLHPYISNLMTLKNMREMGFQIPNDMLTMEAWVDLIRIESFIAKAYSKRGQKDGGK